MPEYSSLLTTSKKEITNMGLYRSSSHVFWRCKYHWCGRRSIDLKSSATRWVKSSTEQFISSAT